MQFIGMTLYVSRVYVDSTAGTEKRSGQRRPYLNGPAPPLQVKSWSAIRKIHSFPWHHELNFPQIGVSPAPPRRSSTTTLKLWFEKSNYNICLTNARVWSNITSLQFPTDIGAAQYKTCRLEWILPQWDRTVDCFVRLFHPTSPSPSPQFYTAQTNNHIISN